MCLFAAVIKSTYFFTRSSRCKVILTVSSNQLPCIKHPLYTPNVKIYFLLAQMQGLVHLFYINKPYTSLVINFFFILWTIEWNGDLNEYMKLNHYKCIILYYVLYRVTILLSVYESRYGEFNSIKETKQLLVTIMFRIT